MGTVPLNPEPTYLSVTDVLKTEWRNVSYRQEIGVPRIQIPIYTIDIYILFARMTFKLAANETTSRGGLGPLKNLGTRAFKFVFTRPKSRVPCSKICVRVPIFKRAVPKMNVV